MTKAKIRKVKFKKRTIFHESIINASSRQDKNTHAFGFFILHKDGEVTSGITYDSGFTPSQLKGACEHMKDTLMEDIFYE